MQNKIIQEIEKRQTARKIPDFGPGDTVVVEVKVKEGDRERVQAYEGVVIARSNRGWPVASLGVKVVRSTVVPIPFRLLNE